MTPNPAEALSWLLSKLAEHRLEYQIVGGLAAIAHGATRPLADIDLYIDYSNAATFLQDMAPYIYWGPEYRKETDWDITYLKLNYAGQKIEIGDSNDAFFFDHRNETWTPQAIDYGSSVRKIVYDCMIQTMPLAQLIAYKSALNREVDREDIQQMLSHALSQ